MRPIAQQGAVYDTLARNRSNGANIHHDYRVVRRFFHPLARFIRR